MPAGVAPADEGGELCAVGETAPGGAFVATVALFGVGFRYGLLTTDGCGLDNGAPESCDTPPTGGAAPGVLGGVVVVVDPDVVVVGGVTVVGYGVAGATLGLLGGVVAGPADVSGASGDCAAGIEVGICGGFNGGTLAELSGVVAAGVGFGTFETGVFKLTPGSALLGTGGVVVVGGATGRLLAVLGDVVGKAGSAGLVGELVAFCGPASVIAGGLGTAVGGVAGVGGASGATLAEFVGAAKLDVDGGNCTCGAVSQ